MILVPFLALFSIAKAQLYEHQDHLKCECSFPGAKFCPSSGECDAVEIGSRLQGLLRAARVYENISWSFPGDEVREMIWKSTCGSLSDPRNNGTFAIILDYTNWEPACISAGDLKMCGLGPRVLPESGRISSEELNGKIRQFYHALKCEASNNEPSLVDNDWEVCRGDNYCNGVQNSTTVEPTTAERVETSSVLPASQPLPQTKEQKAGLDEGSLLLIYIIVPIAFVLLVTIIIFGIVCYRASLWNFVFRVQDRKKKAEQGKNQPISAWNDVYDKV